MKSRLLFGAVILLIASSALLAQGTPGTFTYTGSMGVQRQLASATLISDCNCPADGKVLVAGAVIDGSILTTNEHR